MIRPLAISAALLASCATAGFAAEAFEGAWAQTRRECRDREGPSSGVLINLAGRENGKAAPLFDQYEHHCRIKKVERSGASAKLSLLCYEFWDDYNANKNGRRERATLTPLGRNRLKMNGRTYVRCAN